MKPVSPAASYAALLPDLVEAARELGYALAPHGSMARDFDVIAVPWTEEAQSPEQLILRLLSVTGGQLFDGGHRSEGSDELERTRGDAPTLKPHGRLAWTIYLGHGGRYLDVSVMPRQVAGAPPTAAAAPP